jgi:hypothetical protein
MYITNGTPLDLKVEAITEAAAKHFASDLSMLLLGTLTSDRTMQLSVLLNVSQCDCVITYQIRVDPKPIGYHDPAA